VFTKTLDGSGRDGHKKEDAGHQRERNPKKSEAGGDPRTQKVKERGREEKTMSDRLGARAVST